MNRATILTLIGLLLLSLLLAGCGTGGANYYGAYYGTYYGRPHSYGHYDRGYPVYIGIPDPGPDIDEPIAVPLPMDYGD